MAEALANLATNALYLCNVEISVMDQPSIQGTTVIAMDQQAGPSWMTPIAEYLSHGMLHENRAKAVKVKAIATRYSLVDGMLYRHLFLRPYLRCLPREETDKVIVQVHQGVCGMHIKGQKLCHRIITQGYYWPTMRQEYQEFVRKCDVCQKFGNVIHVPTKALHFVTSLWPFYKWGIDIVGLLLLATG